MQNSIIESISSTIETALSLARAPFPNIPRILALCSLAKRPGLSATVSTANILRKLSCYDIPTEELPDGQPNKMNFLVHTIVEEVFRAIKEDSKSESYGTLEGPTGIVHGYNTTN